jgi:hypothetical protein
LASSQDWEAEELFLENEDYWRTRHEKLLFAGTGRDMLQVTTNTLIAASQQGDTAEVRCRLGELVSAYQGAGDREQMADGGQQGTRATLCGRPGGRFISPRAWRSVTGCPIELAGIR